MSPYGPYDRNPLAAELYDYTPLYSSRADVAFYVDCARQANGKTLELGCGTGRILIPTAAAGFKVVGLDASTSMLDRCRIKLQRQPTEVQKRAHLVHGDMTSFNLNENFALVTIPFRGFQHLLRVEEQLACLSAVHRHLAPGGRLAFDFFHPNPRYLPDPEYLEEREEFGETPLTDGRSFRRTCRIAAYHRAEQVNEIEFIYYLTHADGGKERIVERFPLRYFYRYELEHLLARARFNLVHLYGDFDRTPLRDDSPEMIFVAEKQS
ncbi:MAG TPA: class I SAM-dependent methyltransferase [Candidatus Xenobia bacterium]|nr:class I SAM-dependent methyltransferase [Candidatus Xenobia bacterium]